MVELALLVIQLVVCYNNTPHRIIFYKSELSSKWWMEINEENILPCSFKDYEAAVGGELPDRWITANYRLL